MISTRTTFGMNRSVLNFFHKIMLVAILHSSIIAPSQNLIIGYINYKKPLEYMGLSLAKYDDVSQNTNSNLAIPPVITLVTKSLNSTPTIVSSKRVGLDRYSIPADLNIGFIGVSKDRPLDDPKDNIFKIAIESLPSQDSKVYLTYELFGVQDYTAVSRSFNQRFSTGGYLIKKQNGWTVQKEEIDLKWLHIGLNTITFSIPEKANFSYQVKNLKIEIEKNNQTVPSSLVISKPQISYYKNNQIYLKGFLKNSGTNLKVFFEDQLIDTNNGEFEGFLKLNDAIKTRGFVVVKAFDNQGLLGQEIISIDNLIEADNQFEIKKINESASAYFKAFSANALKTDGARIEVKDSSLTADKEISITKLRSVDIAPLETGLINVTKDGLAYRFLPDGTRFKTPISIALEYDEKLIPNGYTVNDIKTYFFNTTSKSWVEIERDSINKDTREILSLTTHFTDYINGIIQTPESPETAAFAPTMMNDIKAADPSAEMTIISPPEVSQKGDANVSYPIKIPAGRKGFL